MLLLLLLLKTKTNMMEILIFTFGEFIFYTFLKRTIQIFSTRLMNCYDEIKIYYN